jgi:hypothetical protein
MDDINPYQSPETIENIATDSEEYEYLSIRRQKRNALLIMVALFAVLGLINGVTPEHFVAGRVIDLAGAIGFAILLIRWCSLDCFELGIEPWAHIGIMLIICPGPFILMPIYFLKTRGFRGLLSMLWSAAFFVLLMAVSVVSAVAAAVIVDGINDL